MYQEHSGLQAAGQMLLTFAFLATGGFVLQFAGAILLVLDIRVWGAALLIAFTVLASAIFHRWWLIADPMLRHLHLSNLIVNCGIIGGLLLVAAI